MSYFTAEGLRRSKRIAEKEIDPENPETVITATLDDAVEAAGVPDIPSGGKRRGGAKTIDAMKALVVSANEKGTELANKLDDLGEKIVQGLPAAGLATATGIALNHPTVFATIVTTLKNTAVASINASTIATWGEYAAAVAEIGKAGVGLVSGAAAASLRGPYVPLVAGLAVMRYRASKADVSLTDLIKQDASALFSAAARITTGQIQAFNTAATEEAKKKVTDTLREIGMRVEVTPSDSSTAVGSKGFPSYGGPVQGVPEGAEVRRGTKRKPEPSAALGPLTTSTEERNPKRIALDSSGLNTFGGGRRHRKTKKRAMKKRRMTRRKMPTFSY